MKKVKRNVSPHRPEKTCYACLLSPITLLWNFFPPPSVLPKQRIILLCKLLPSYVGTYSKLSYLPVNTFLVVILSGCTAVHLWVDHYLCSQSECCNLCSCGWIITHSMLRKCSLTGMLGYLPERMAWEGDRERGLRSRHTGLGYSRGSL